MPSVRLDKVVFSTFHEAYTNYATQTGVITVANTGIANATSRDQSVSIPYTRGGTRADIYVEGSLTGYKTMANAGTRSAASVVYQFAGLEVATLYIQYSSSVIEVGLRITNNTGATINPPAQTITVTVVQYDAPITSL